MVEEIINDDEEPLCLWWAWLQPNENFQSWLHSFIAISNLLHHFYQTRAQSLYILVTNWVTETTRIPSGPGCALGNVSAFTPASQLVRKRTKLAWMEMLCHEHILYNRVPKYRRLSLINGDNKSGWQKDIDKIHYRLPILQQGIFSVGESRLWTQNKKQNGLVLCFYCCHFNAGW